MCPVSHTHDPTDADVSGKNVFHSRDIKLAKVPSLGSPYMSIGKICADLVSQSCFLYSPQNTHEHPGSCAEDSVAKEENITTLSSSQEEKSAHEKTSVF